MLKDRSEFITLANIQIKEVIPSDSSSNSSSEKESDQEAYDNNGESKEKDVVVIESDTEDFDIINELNQMDSDSRYSRNSIIRTQLIRTWFSSEHYFFVRAIFFFELSCLL